MGILKRLPVACLFLFSALCLARENADDQRSQDVTTGFWRGVYRYGDGGPEPVKFKLVMVQDGSTVAGYITEPNSFGKPGEPWLHALIKGEINKQTGELAFTKTYDGTAGQSHDVQYTGKPAQDGNKFEGSWTIDNNVGGEFTLVKAPKTRSGPLAGIWSGIYEYPDGKGESVRFTMIMIHDRQGVSGLIKETNTFGNKSEPWLTAGFKGHVDNKTGKLTFTKTYDGTAGEDHDVAYQGSISKDGSKVEGTWTIVDEASGRFTIEKLPVNAKTLDDLK